MRIYNSTQIDEIAFELKNKKAIIIATDTVFGILSLDSDLIYKIKNRQKTKKLVTLLSDYNLISINKKIKKILENYIPGPLTVVFEKESYRIPNSLLIKELIGIVGPIYSSSANISGEKPIKNFQEAVNLFKKWPHEICIVESENISSGIASTIIDLDIMKVLRKGELDGKEILEKIKQVLEIKNV